MTPLLSLSDHEIQLLYVLALQGGMHKTRLADMVRHLGMKDPTGRRVTAADVMPMLDTLRDGGWVVVSDGRYQLVAEQENQLLLHLAEQPDCLAWLKMLETSQPEPWRVFSERCRLWLALLRGELEKAAEALALWLDVSGMPADHPAYTLLQDEFGARLMARLDDDIQAMLLIEALLDSTAVMLDFTVVYRYGLSRLADGLGDYPELLEQLGWQALWRGEDEVLERLYPDHLLPASLVILAALLQGHAEQAMQVLQSLLTRYRAATRKRKIELPPDINQLAILTLLASGDSQHYPMLRQLIQFGEKNHFSPCYAMLGYLLDTLEGRLAESALPVRCQLEPGLSGLITALSLHWSGLCIDTEKWLAALILLRDGQQAHGYVGMAQELDALLSLQSGLPRSDADWHQRNGRQPLVMLYQRKEAWQHALSALALLKPQASPGQDAGGIRLAWLITLGLGGRIVLEPREQKQSAKGVWSKGRAVALKRLHDTPDEFPYLLGQDTQALRHIRLSRDHYYYGGSQYELDADAALPALAGHPALFWSDAPDVRIDVAQGQVALQLTSFDSQIELRLIPDMIQPDSTVVWEKETPTRLVVYQVGEEVRQIAGIVGRKLAVPASAKPQLVAAVSAIAPLLPIRSDLPELSPHIATVEPITTLCAHLLPLEAGLRLQLLVQPLAGGSWYSPGVGSTQLLGEQDGTTVQTTRRIEVEQANLAKVLNRCPALAYAESTGREWQLADPQAALEVLAQLRALPAEELLCVWPEGERMRIAAQRGTGSMRFALKRQGDWFELSGALTLDDGQVLQLRQVLDLMKTSRGRFVQLGERDWLALDESLRKHLAQLATLSDGNGKEEGLRLNRLALPMLAGLASQAGGFEGDADWHAQLAHLDSLQDWNPAVPSTLQAELRDYQREGYVWLSRLARWGVGACLADDMGLGKTVQTLALLLERAPGGPQLVVAPTSVAMNWLAETARFAPTLKVRAYHQQRDVSELGAFDLVVVSYGLLQQEAESFCAVHWHSVVLDEAQAIKNARTKRSRAAMDLKADFRMVASGTPLENHLGELWTLFRFLNPGLLGSQQRFAERFVEPIERQDADARKALKSLIQPFMLRRSKQQVLDELPPRTEITVKVALSEEERHWYEALRQQAIDTLAVPGDDGKPLQVLAEITRLRRFCCHPSLVLENSMLDGSKLAAFAGILDELLENRHKALVFSQFVDHLAIVRRYLDEQGIAYLYLDGSTSPAERKSRVDAFQAGGADVFLISLKAGGTGLNLTAADYVIHLDPWWNPAVEDQASDRAHRMGQQRPVTVYRLVAEHTIEEQIVALHGKKRDLADSLLEGGEVSAKLDADALLGLLRGAG